MSKHAKHNIALPNWNSNNAVDGGVFLLVKKRGISQSFFTTWNRVKKHVSRKNISMSGISDTNPDCDRKLYRWIFVPACMLDWKYHPHILSQVQSPIKNWYTSLLFLPAFLYSPLYTNHRHLKKLKLRYLVSHCNYKS